MTTGDKPEVNEEDERAIGDSIDEVSDESNIGESPDVEYADEEDMITGDKPELNREDEMAMGDSIDEA